MFGIDINSQAKHWDGEWYRRTNDGPGVQMNPRKMRQIIKELSKRKYYADSKVLDIGCGSGIHAVAMMQHFPRWEYNYTGIDLSKLGVEYARKLGLTAFVESIYDTNLSGFDLFLFLDTLEHMEYHDRIAAKLRQIAKYPFHIFGNIPLYSTSTHSNGGCERMMDVNILHEFLKQCGASRFWQKIYGSHGYPYMLFEAQVLQ
jgi:2-polyprenyl-3-methyl-5-hydroxy-6-metoxy-1,4-benzoquinol methylase